MTARSSFHINRKALIPLLAYTGCVFFVTLIYRESGLAPQLQPVPFWSFSEWIDGSFDTGFNIVLNVLLFVPFGYLLASFFGGRKLLPVLLSFACSLVVEAGQYLSCRGVFDVDDLITNTLGGVIGVLIYLLFQRLGGARLADASWLALALVFVGVAGCLYNVKLDEDSVGTVYERQFAFNVDELRRDGDGLTISGDCRVYKGTAPAYTLLLKGERGEVPMKTEISGDRFTAKADSAAEGKCEILVRFGRRAPVGTRVWVSGDRLEYVPGALPEKPSFLPENAVLKAVNDEYGVRIWQDGKTLYWVIERDIPADTELVCHLFTNEPWRLPEARRASRFDNIGFFADLAGGQELKGFDGCRVFTMVLPDSYSVSAVMAGYALGGRVIWEENFRP